jgi:hypothetical protein
MASVLPFDNASIGGVSVPAAEFVEGSGVYKETGHDNAVTTADGRIHNYRQTITREASFECYGDKSALATGKGLGVAVTVGSVGSFTGLVTAAYDTSNRKTSVSVKGDPAAA